MSVSKFFAAAFAAAALAGSNALAQSNILLDLPGVQGGSQLSGYEGRIDLLSMSLGITGANKKACVAQDVSVVKFVDKSTADLIMSTATGVRYPTARIIFLKAGGEALRPVMKFEFRDVQLSSYSGGGSGGSDLPTEVYSLSYGAVTGTVFNQNNDGTVTPEPFAANCVK